MELARRVLECFIFIQDILWSFVAPNKDVALLPDDILIDILSRLPAHSIQQCHRVCRSWRALTSTRQFAEMQFRRAESMIFMQCFHPTDRHGPFHLQVFDEKARRFRKFKFKPKTMDAIKKFTRLRLNSSYCGLLLLRPGIPHNGCVVIDPFTEVVKYIYFPLSGATVCGLFFQPLASEYKILMFGYGDKDYFVYGSKSLTWRNITFGSFTFRPHDNSPVILNRALHWLVDPRFFPDDEIDLCMHALMVFDMDSEKFRTMPHPNFKRDHPSSYHRRMSLFEKDGSLYLCNMLAIFRDQIEMWELKDYQNWIWVKRYRLYVPMLPRLRDFYPTMAYFLSYSIKKLNIVRLNKEELLIEWFSYGLYILNVNQMTLRELQDQCDVRDCYGDKVCWRPKLFTSYKCCMHPSAR